MPLMIQYWLSKYRRQPIARISTAMPRKVAPRGLPISLRREAAAESDGDEPMEVLRRKSCVMAMPMEANATEVRSQARKVRSI